MTETYPEAPAPETVKSFMDRVWSQNIAEMSADDASTLTAIAMIGSQRMIQLGGEDVVPSSR